MCDECNMERDGPHELITKTYAKKQLLLTDSQIEIECSFYPSFVLFLILITDLHYYPIIF